MDDSTTSAAVSPRDAQPINTGMTSTNTHTLKHLNTVPAAASGAGALVLALGHVAQLVACGLAFKTVGGGGGGGSSYATGGVVAGSGSGGWRLIIDLLHFGVGGGIGFCTIIAIVSMFAIGFRFLNQLKSYNLLEQLDSVIKSFIFSLYGRIYNEDRVRAFGTSLRDLQSSFYHMNLSSLLFIIGYGSTMIFMTLKVIAHSFVSIFGVGDIALDSMHGYVDRYTDHCVWIGLAVGWIDLVANYHSCKGGGYANNSAKLQQTSTSLSLSSGVNIFKSIAIDSLTKNLYIVVVTQVILISISFEKKIIFTLIDSLLVCFFTAVYSGLLQLVADFYQNRARIITSNRAHLALSTSSSSSSRKTSTSEAMVPSSRDLKLSDDIINSYVALESPIEPHRNSPMLRVIFKILFGSLFLQSICLFATRQVYCHGLLVFCCSLFSMYLVFRIFFTFNYDG